VIGLNNFSEESVIRLAASAEAKSSHPLAQAVLNEAKRRKIALVKKIERFKNLAGLGVQAMVNNQELLIGTPRLIEQRRVDLSEFQTIIDELTAKGATIVILTANKKAVGILGAQDPIKPNAQRAVNQLRALNIEVAMITGDNEKTAQVVARQLGIDRVFAEVLPEDKAQYVKDLQGEGKFVAMVGDGVNDAPALAQADIGIAIGAGTDVAIETAKVVLMKSDPADILRAIRLSQATVQKMKQNLFWASIYNLLAIPIAAGLLYPKFGLVLRPEIAALFMSLSSIIVATNAVLLNRVEKQLTD
jgi:Cu2+-exporting ATPase